MSDRVHRLRLACAAALLLTTAAAVADPATAAKQVRQGLAAMAANHLDEAKAAFTAALAAEPTNAAAHRGLGLVLLRQGDTVGAAQPLEAAASRGGINDSSLALAVAAERVAGGHAVRAVRELTDYLESHAKPPVDEPLVNALGVALAKVNGPAVDGTVFRSGESLYGRLNAALEKARPGQRRWGVEWQPAADVTARLTAWRQARAAVDEATARLAQQTQAKRAADDRVAADEQLLPSRGLRTLLSRDRSAAATAERQVKAAQGKADAVRATLAATPGPTFPDAVPIDSLGGNGDGGTATLASTSTAAATATHDTANPTEKAPPVGADTTGADPAGADPAPTPPAVPTAEPRRAVGFAVAPDLIVTTAAAVAHAGRVHVDGTAGLQYDATVVRTDAKLGLALLRVSGTTLPCLTLSSASTVATGAIRCGGYPVEGLIHDKAKVMTGTVAAAPVAGQPWTVQLSDAPRLGGGPLLAADGTVAGVELGDDQTPADRVPAVPAGDVRRFVGTDAHPAADEAAAQPQRALVQVVADGG